MSCMRNKILRARPKASPILCTGMSLEIRARSQRRRLWNSDSPSGVCRRYSSCDTSGDSDELPTTGDTVMDASPLLFAVCGRLSSSAVGRTTSPISMIASSTSCARPMFFAKSDERRDMPRVLPRELICAGSLEGAPVGEGDLSPLDELVFAVPCAVVSVDFVSSFSSRAPVSMPISSKPRLLLPILEPSSPEKRTLVRPPSSEDLGCVAGASPREELAPKSSCRNGPESKLPAALGSRAGSPGSRGISPLDAPATGDGDLELGIACVCLNLYSCKAVTINLSCFSCLSTSQQVRNDHNTVIAARNDAFRASSQPSRFRCSALSSSQVLERVDFARCDKHIRACESLGRTSCLLDE